MKRKEGKRGPPAAGQNRIDVSREPIREGVYLPSRISYLLGKNGKRDSNISATMKAGERRRSGFHEMD